MDNAGVELPCTGSLHSPAIILKIQAIFLKIQAVILKIQAIILTKGVRSRILGRLVTWVLDGIGNSWIFHDNWLDRHDPSTLESRTISGFQSIISGCTKISFLDCTRLWCKHLEDYVKGVEGNLVGSANGNRLAKDLLVKVLVAQILRPHWSVL